MAESFQAFWAPQMSEYGKVAAKAQKFTQMNANILDALSTLADALCGPIA